MGDSAIVPFWRCKGVYSTQMLWALSLYCDDCDLPGSTSLLWCGHCQRWVCVYCTAHDVSDVELACFENNGLVAETQIIAEAARLPQMALFQQREVGLSNGKLILVASLKVMI